MTSTMERNRTTVATRAVTIGQSSVVQVAAAYLLRYGLVLVIAWIGGLSRDFLQGLPKPGSYK